MASAAERTENVEREIANLNGMIANLNEEIANLNEEFANRNEKFETEFANLKGMIANLDENLNRRIAKSDERIAALEQKMRARKEFVEDDTFQRPIPENALGSCSVESDNSNMESQQTAPGGSGKEEGGSKMLKESEFDPSMMMSDQEKPQEEIKKPEVEQEENVMAHQFKFRGKIGSRNVIVFVGLSATHNFSSKKLVNELGIPSQRTQSKYRVNFGSGPGSEGAEICRGVILQTHGIEIVENFFVTDLEIAEVVLGNLWLRSLGDTALQGMPMVIAVEGRGGTVNVEADTSSLPRRTEDGSAKLEWI